MKRSETPLLVILGSLLLAVVLWLGLWVWQRVSDPVRSTLAVPVTLEEAEELEGVLLREERVLCTQWPLRLVTAPTGRRVAAGAVLGAGAGDAGSLRRAELCFAASSEGGYAPALSRGDMAAAALSCGAAAWTAEFPETGAERLLAPAGGLFSPRVDGWEHLDPAWLAGLTPSGLEEALSAPAEPEKGAYGRLITGQSWYFAAAVPEETAARLIPGERAELCFPGGETVTAAVCTPGPAEAGRQVVVLRCTGALRETMDLRFARCRAVLSRRQVLQLPPAALRQDEEGTFVYQAQGLTARRAAVTLLRERDGSVLVDSGALRPGSEILIGGSRLYDGCLLTQR